jgi:mono/diheme cytochrome c family protein
MNSRITFAVMLVALAGGACNVTHGDNGGYSSSTPSTIAPTPGPQPTFSATAQSLDVAPPPISGGTLTVAPDGHTVVAADSDRDRIYVVDIPTRTVKFDIPLAPQAEPGRVAIDSHNHAHVALRGSGSLASIDLATGIKTEQPICIAPRGVAYDQKVDSLYVACSEGILVTVPLAGGAVKKLSLDTDLRDVLVHNDQIFVSHFRSATVNVLSRDGQVLRVSTQGGNLGWRIAEPPTDNSPDVALVSQDPTNPTPVPGGVGYYGSGAVDACNSPTITTTRLDVPGESPITIPPAVLPVDLATNHHEYAIVAAGNGHTSDLPQILVHQIKSFAPDGSYDATNDTTDYTSSAYGTNPDCLALTKGYVPGQAVAAAFDGDDNLIVQSREPAKLFIMSPDRTRVYKEISLSDVSKEDSGHAIFHSNSGGFIACASCHAEGGEDGRTWEFIEGQRRTPSMRGTIEGTAPYHWDGEMANLRALVDHVFVTRMSGPKVDDAHVGSLQTWLNRMPAPPKQVRPADSVQRGSALFQSQGCVTCHSGQRMTNNQSVDVGTGGVFQVPSLIGVSWRSPFLHNGCAKTLKDRFDPSCGGAAHGNVATLNSDQIKDLTTYLETL